ncbi:MAG: response regulator [Archangium sp.]|nr:response regulator [Archangium sp.]
MPKSVLVADDSLTIRKIVGMLFAMEDFTLTAVDNGLDAVAKARELRPDLVIADCMMPGKNGYEVCQELKSDPSTSHIPVLLLAGNFEPFDPARAQAVGANGHIPKPFDSTSFLDRVRASVGMAPAAAQPNPLSHLGPSTTPMGAPAAPNPQQIRPPAAPPQPLQGISQPRPMPGLQGQPGQPLRPMPGVPMGTQPGMPPRPMGVPMGTQPGMPPRPMGMPMGQPGMPPGGMPPRPMGVPMGTQPGMPPRPMGVPGMPGTMPPGPGMARPPMAGTPGMPPAPGMPGGFPRPPGAAPLPGVPRRDPFGLPGHAPPQQHQQPHPPQRTESLDLDSHRGAGDGGEAHLREALSKASKEVIEKIAWEVVPQLAETIIREELERLIKDREAKGLA